MIERIAVFVDEITVEATDVLRLVLRRPDGCELPPFTPGAHIDLFLPNGLTRQYSLLHDCRQRRHYEIAVHKAPDSRGGSAFIHTSLRGGAQLEISAPRNNFPLDTRHKALFIAGGIGITPIFSRQPAQILALIIQIKRLTKDIPIKNGRTTHERRSLARIIMEFD